MLSHMLSEIQSVVPYLCQRVRPCTPVVVCGRSAGAEPRCDPKTAVYYGWKHRLLPYMLYPGHAEDTLFLVAEEDFRFYRGDCEAPGGSEPSAPHRALRDAAAQAAGVAAASSSGDTHASFELQQHGALQNYAGETSEDGCDNELVDLVAMCTAAKRAHCGDFVWLSWNAQGKKKLSFGSTLIAITRAGARYWEQFLQSKDWGARPYHMDCVFKAHLESGHCTLEASYAFPAVGSFMEHVSGCDPGMLKKKETRPSMWGDHTQEGTRKLLQKDVHRSLCGFTQGGGGHKDVRVREVILPDQLKALTWLSLKGQPAPALPVPPPPPGPPPPKGSNDPPPPPPRTKPRPPPPAKEGYVAVEVDRIEGNLGARQRSQLLPGPPPAPPAQRASSSRDPPQEEQLQAAEAEPQTRRAKRKARQANLLESRRVAPTREDSASKKS